MPTIGQANWARYATDISKPVHYSGGGGIGGAVAVGFGMLAFGALLAGAVALIMKAGDAAVGQPTSPAADAHQGAREVERR